MKRERKDKGRQNRGTGRGECKRMKIVCTDEAGKKVRQGKAESGGTGHGS